jgi:hypothetical protein
VGSSAGEREEGENPTDAMTGWGLGVYSCKPEEPYHRKSKLTPTSPASSAPFRAAPQGAIGLTTRLPDQGSRQRGTSSVARDWT